MSLIISATPRIKTCLLDEAIAENKLLRAGEAIYLTDTKQLKIGNGSDRFNALPYFGESGGGMFHIPAPRLTVDEGQLCVIREPFWDDLKPLSPRFILVKRHRSNVRKRARGFTAHKQQKGWSKKNYVVYIVGNNSGTPIYEIGREDLRPPLAPGLMIRDILSMPIPETISRKRDIYKIPLTLNNANGVSEPFTRNTFLDRLLYQLYQQSWRKEYISLNGRIISREELEYKKYRPVATFGIAIELDVLVNHTTTARIKYRSEAGKFLFGLKKERYPQPLTLGYNPWWSIV